MRIRKVIEKWSWKIFALIFAIMAAIYNGFFIIGYGKGGFQASDEVYFWLINGVLMPTILAAAISGTVRKATLFIDEIQEMPGICAFVTTHIESLGFTITAKTEKEINFTPTSWFYKLFQSWFGTEKIEMIIGNELTITGPLKRITSLEEILIGNKDLKKD